MKSSRNRSRSKGNRNRSVGNVMNRVFDSSGPEGKVRGTPQQIIDKYNQLTRDAQLGGDRVAAENFQQHAEHYLRLLAEAQREQEARREQQQQNQQNQQNNNQQGGGQNRQSDPSGQSDQGRNRRDGDQPAAPPQPDAENKPFDAVIDANSQADAGLVETPESAPKPKRSRSRRPKKSDDAQPADGAGASPEAPEAAE
ncbi:MAG: DUF4167 domain-containing protein [Pseudomonadota bacterium]